MANEVTTRQARPIDVIKSGLEQLPIERSLPSDISPDKFRNTVLTAINLHPELATADRTSLFSSCMKAANDGMLPDGREGSLVIYNTKVKREGQEVLIKAVQWMPQAQGLIQKMYKNPDVSSVRAHPVYQNDKFRFVLMPEETIEHEPTMGDPGELVCAYAVVKFKDGRAPIIEVVPRRDIDKARLMSKSKDGPAWTSWYPEMARKVGIHRVSKYVPLPAEAARVINHAASGDDDVPVIELQAEAAPALTAPTPTAAPKSKLEQFEGPAETPKMTRKPRVTEAPAATPAPTPAPTQAATVIQPEPEPESDPETGEIIEGDFQEVAEEEGPTPITDKEAMLAGFASCQSRSALMDFWRSEESQERLARLNGTPELVYVQKGYGARHKELPVEAETV